jgi:large subunit ribosomal protein L4
MSTAVGNGTAVDLTKDAPESVTVDVRDPQGAVTGSVELPGAIFGVQVNVPLIHQVVVAQLAAARQGTHDTKTRGEVRGGGRKPYRQKGTGRARQGSTRAPQFTGGGVVHGPTPRSYAQRTPKKMIAAALRGALSDRARNGRIHVLSSVVDGDSPSTKAAVAALTQISDRRHLLLVVERADDVARKSLRNVDRVHVLVADQLNTYDVLVSDDVVFTRGALDAFITGRPKGKAAKAVATESEVDMSKDEQSGVELSKAEHDSEVPNSEEAAQ